MASLKRDMGKVLRDKKKTTNYKIRFLKFSPSVNHFIGTAHNMINALKKY